MFQSQHGASSLKTQGRGFKNFVKAVAVSGALALTLSACASGDTPAEETPSTEGAANHGELSIQLSWIKNEEFAGEYFADSNGYFADAGFSGVTMTPGPSTGVAELLSGSAHVALSDSSSVGTAIANEDAPLKIIGATFQKNPFTILSLADGGNIATPEDLLGKKIGVQDSNASVFAALLAANDISPDDLEIVPVQYDPSPLIEGQVDGFVAYLTNEAISVAAEGYDTVNLTYADNGLPYVAETFTVTDEFLAENRDLLKDFLIAEIKGWSDNIQDPEEGARLAVEEYGADLDLDYDKTLEGNHAQIQLITTEETEANGLFTISDALKEQTIASLNAAGLEITADELFDTTLLDEIYAENPDLVNYAG